MKRVGYWLLVVAALCGCGPFSPWTVARLDVTGSGSGTASGDWTDHFNVSRRPWRLLFQVDCSHAASSWSVDLTLEKMYQNRYYQAVPIDVGWSEGSGPARVRLTRRIAQTGEFWFIVYASSGCSWHIAAPSQ